MRRMAVVLVVLGLSACWFGCGGGDYSSPKATMQTMHAAGKAGNRDGVLNCFDDASRKAITELEKVMKEVAKDVPDMAKEFGGGDMVGKMSEEMKKQELKIGEEKIDGDKATLKVTMVEDKKENTDIIPFVRERGAWKMKLPGEIPSPEKIREMAKMMKAMMQGAKGK